MPVKSSQATFPRISVTSAHSADATGRTLTASVVVCVYTEDRWGYIEEALDSLQQQTSAPTEVIVVVDHNEALRERLAAAFPSLHVVANAYDRGLSGARNTGIDRTSGDVVAFLDDDARAEGGWLEAMMRPYEDPNVMGVGGLIVPDWEGDRAPAWLPDEFLWTVGCSYRGLPTVTADVRNPIGASMSFRRDAFVRAGLFDSSVGRNDDSTAPMGCEETEFSIRLRNVRAGARIVYEPGSVVHHNVASSRATWGYFRSRCFAEGMSKRRVSAAASQGSPLGVERGYVMNTLLHAIGRDANNLVRKGDRHAAQRMAAVVIGVTWAAAGYARGAVAAK
jgi:glycosyltransferase involved in cell wall biosynthesis